MKVRITTRELVGGEGLLRQRSEEIDTRTLPPVVPGAYDAALAVVQESIAALHSVPEVQKDLPWYEDAILAERARLEYLLWIAEAAGGS